MPSGANSDVLTRLPKVSFAYANKYVLETMAAGLIANLVNDECVFTGLSFDLISPRSLRNSDDFRSHIESHLNSALNRRMTPKHSSKVIKLNILELIQHKQKFEFSPKCGTQICKLKTIRRVCTTP